jgi:HlyD family secretion protein
MTKSTEQISESFSELLNDKPNHLFRFGNSIVLLLLIAVIIFTFLITYPTVLSAKVTLSSYNPAIKIYAKQSGKIIDVNIKSGDVVKKGDVLLVIESTANYNHIQFVSRLIDFPETASCSSIFSQIDTLILGDITTSYISLIQECNEFQQFKNDNFFEIKINYIKKEIAQYDQLQLTLENQVTLYKKEHQLIEKDYHRHLLLYSEKTISSSSIEQIEKGYISSQRILESMRTNAINNTITIYKLNQSVTQLELENKQQYNKHIQQISYFKQKLKSDISAWRDKHVIQSPIDGRLSLFASWNKNTTILLGDPILNIVPFNKEKMVAKLFLPTTNSAKIKVGQRVNIKLKDYPYQEYGMLTGTIHAISLVPDNDVYFIEVWFNTTGLTSTYGKKLEYKANMEGIAEVMIDNTSLFYKVFNRVFQSI